MKRNPLPRFALCLLAAVCPLGPALAGDLTVKVMDVGQGDAVLVRCPDGDHTLLIDAGCITILYPGSVKMFKDQINSAFEGQERVITTVVTSHPHADHIGNMQWVLDEFAVENYVDNGEVTEKPMSVKLHERVEEMNDQGALTYWDLKDLTVVENIPFCPKTKLKVVSPRGWNEDLDDINDGSLIVRLEYGQKSFLFVGDAEEPAEETLREHGGDLLNVDVLKVGHHGSHSSSTKAFIEAVSPDIAIISCGSKDVGANKKTYKHPRLVTMATYNTWFGGLSPVDHPETGAVFAYNAEDEEWQSVTRRYGLWMTVNDGTVTVTCDGANVNATPEKTQP
ncbi:MAG: MBL fold metallo-hydrolase [Prosthecobacter sp.]|nr:MBL fold metallo-hydrolase [Prosthecobacter sp.]